MPDASEIFWFYNGALATGCASILIRLLERWRVTIARRRFVKAHPFSLLATLEKSKGGDTIVLSPGHCERIPGSQNFT